MAEPSAQDIQEQVKQAQQSAMAQAQAVQQQAAASIPKQILPTPPAPIQPPTTQTGVAKMSGVPVCMGKISLLAASFSLMMLGALTFLSGFLLGLWFAGPTKQYPVNNYSAADLQTLGQSTANQMYPPQYQTPPQSQPIPSQGTGLEQNLKQGAQAIGFGHIAAAQSRNITQSAISGVTVPNVPSFLSPLVTSTQFAVGQQLGYKAQQQVGQHMNQAISAPPPQAQTAPNYAQPPQSQTQPSNIPAQQQQAAPSPAQQPLNQGATPLSQGTKSTDDGFTVQLGVFAARDNAQDLVNHLQALNYTSQVVEGKSPEGNAIFYVNSGLYNDFKTATEAATQFAAQNIPGALIVKISKSSKGNS